jgi:hypothetical protein
MAAATESQRTTEFKRLTLNDGHGVTTIDGPHTALQEGFHFRVVLDATPLTVYARGSEACGVRDGRIVARGRVTRVETDEVESSATLYARPPQ